MCALKFSATLTCIGMHAHIGMLDSAQQVTHGGNDDRMESGHGGRKQLT